MALFEKKEKKNPIEDAQKELGKADETHYAQKEPLLKAKWGSVTSNLALTKYWNPETGEYDEPVPTYSLYIMERILTDGHYENKITNIPIEKDAGTFRQISEHFAQLAKAVEGIELTRSAKPVDDVDAAIDKLKAFRK